MVAYEHMVIVCLWFLSSWPAEVSRGHCFAYDFCVASRSVWGSSLHGDISLILCGIILEKQHSGYADSVSKKLSVVLHLTKPEEKKSLSYGPYL